MSRILVTSCKGGVGKSTVSIGVATALASMGKRVLLIDFDLGNRSLDLMLGMQDDLIYDICDLTGGRADCASVVHLHPDHPNLAFIGAPFRYDGDADEASFAAAMDKLEKEFDFDYIFVDTSGGAHESVAIAAPACDTALIVSSQSPIAIRAAEKSGILLDEKEVSEQYLIINGLDTQTENLAKRTGIIEVIDRTRTPLIGIIPMDTRIALLSEQGKSVFDGKKSNCRTAFENIAKRLCGVNVPLMKGFCGIKRDKFLFR